MCLCLIICVDRYRQRPEKGFRFLGSRSKHLWTIHCACRAPWILWVNNECFSPPSHLSSLYRGHSAQDLYTWVLISLVWISRWVWSHCATGWHGCLTLKLFYSLTKSKVSIPVAPCFCQHLMLSIFSILAVMVGREGISLCFEDFFINVQHLYFWDSRHYQPVKHQ